ncbi:MAG: EAL domain-containing protein [Magnetovibrionaceae bacterium]
MAASARIGVGARLLVGLTVLALFTVIVAIVAVRSFEGFGDSASRIAGEQLDIVIAASELARQSESAAALGPALALPETQGQLEALTDQVRDQVVLLNDALAGLDGRGLDPDRLQRLKWLADDLAGSLLALGEAVDRRLFLRLSERQIRSSVLDLASAVRGGASLVARERVFAAINLIERVFLVTRTGDLRTVEEALTGLSGDAPRTGVEDLFQSQVDELAIQAVRVRRDVLTNRSQLAALLNANEIAAGRMVSEVATLVSQLRETALSQTQVLNEDMSRRSGLILMVTGLCIFGAITLVVYVQGSVVERIRNLREAMVGRMEGGDAPIPTDSNDEIGDMARVLDFYVRSLQDRENDLKASERKFRDLAQTVPGMIFQWRESDSHGRGYAYVSPRAEELFGVAPEVLMADWRAFPVHAGDAERFLEARTKAVEESFGWTFEGRFIRPNGEVGWWQEIVKPVRLLEHETLYAGVALDVTQRRQAEEGLRMALKVFETASEGIIVSDQDNRIKAVNPAFTRITGYTEDDVRGRDPSFLSSGRHDDAFYKELWIDLSNRGHWEGEIWNRRKNGEVYPEWLSVSAIRDSDGQIAEYVGVFSDITKRKRDEEQIRFQANYDALTRMPNRVLFQDRLEGAISRAGREQETFALMFIDLDRFKIVNDTLGHAAGDVLLERSAKRLTNCVRQMDTVARFGGDEFTIILQDMARGRDAAIVAGNIIQSISEAFALDDGQQAFIGASIGIAVYPGDGETSEALIRNADMAMYRAKEAGRNQYRFFTPEMDAEALKRMSLENDLRRAVEQGQFFVVYQPIIELSTGNLAGAEALVRWNHPEEDEVGPDRFIPVAEDSGLIAVLGEWVFQSVCHQLKTWRTEGLPVPRISVNLSSRQLKKGLPLERITEVLKESGLLPKDLAFEITESGIISDEGDAVGWLEAVRDFGIGLSIDDFGTGYSSLSYLTRLPVDTVKIDRHFVQRMCDEADDAQLVEAIIKLAHSLGFKVVAEGVETEQQLAFLRHHNCDFLQGFHYSKPLEAGPFEDYVRRLTEKKPGRITLTSRSEGEQRVN